MDEHEGTGLDEAPTQDGGPKERLDGFYQSWAQVTSDSPMPLAARRQDLLADYRKRLSDVASGALEEPPPVA